MDPNLTATWDQKKERFTILRRSSIRPEDPPELILVIQDAQKQFRPLDDRVLDWLAEADCQRMFYGRDQRYFAELVDNELKAREEVDRKNREKPVNDKFEALEDGLAWLMKKEPAKLWKHELDRMNVLK